MAHKTRVLIVDDSSIVRAILQSSLSAHPAIEVVGYACDGAEAIPKIRTLRPDVVTLDVEMPKMNGIEVLQRVGGKLPVAFVMCSTLTQAGAQVTFEALRLGAFDYVPKPDHGGFAGNQAFRKMLHGKVLAAAKQKGRVRSVLRATGSGPSQGPKRLPPNRVSGWVLGIGISCGGPQTLHRLLPAFPSDFVPIVVTQHMPAQFTASFAQHLDRACPMQVVEAKDGMKIQQGVVYIAPGSHHLEIVRRGVALACRLNDGPEVSGHRPSVDVMFASLARASAARAIGLIMTGMGSDGARGLQQLRRAGGRSLAQDEATSLVYGMPKAAMATGAVEQQCPLDRLPDAVNAMLQGKSRAGIIQSV